MTDTGSMQHAVDSLEPTLALVVSTLQSRLTAPYSCHQLKETGKFFRATQSNDSIHVAIARTALSQAIPSANLRLHDALDDLETEIACNISQLCDTTSLTVC